MNSQEIKETFPTRKPWELSCSTCKPRNMGEHEPYGQKRRSQGSPWGSGYWPVPFSSDEALQIAGLFHQGQFPYCSRYEAGRVQHFPDFNSESIFITKNMFIMKDPTDFGKMVENGVDPCLPNFRLQLSSW